MTGLPLCLDPGSPLRLYRYLAAAAERDQAVWEQVCAAFTSQPLLWLPGACCVLYVCRCLCVLLAGVWKSAGHPRGIEAYRSEAGSCCCRPPASPASCRPQL